MAVTFAAVEAVARADGAGEHPHVGDLLPRRPALDLEHGAGGRRAAVALARRQQRGDAGDERVDARAGAGRADVHRMHAAAPDLRCQRAAEPRPRQRRAVLDVGLEQGVVPVGEQLGERPLVIRRDRGRAELLRDLAQHPRGVGAPPVGLVDEHDHRDAQPLQRTHQHARLRLHALDRGHDEHRAVEHGQDPLHLGDEVRVAGGVDQVDGDVAGGERRHRGLDRDAAPAFQRERVGCGVAVVDTAELVDDACVVQQAFGQRGLTGVYVGEDAQIEDSHSASCPPNGSGWVWT